METFEAATTPEDKKVRNGYDGTTPTRTKRGDILLIPQPSSDPRDPLVSPFSLINAFAVQKASRRSVIY